MGKQCKIADFNTHREIPDTGFKHPEVDDLEVDSIRCSNRSIRSIRSIRIASIGFDRSIDARARRTKKKRHRGDDARSMPTADARARDGRERFRRIERASARAFARRAVTTRGAVDALDDDDDAARARERDDDDDAMATRARADDDAIKAKDRLNRESARASTSRGATETIEYGTFHARVGAVFGDGDGGGWRPRSNAVTRRGGDGDGGDGEDASESASERCGDDLDCLESDEEGDDDARKMTRLAASVGRCRALDGEADFDEDDALALGVDARERRSMNGVTSMVERARAVGAPSAVDRVPDHVANPAKYTRYALDEELTVGSGRVSNARGPSSATGDEHPNTPTIHVERESVEALPKPRFSRAAAANAKSKTKKRAAPESSVATRADVRVHLDDDDDVVDGRDEENDDDRCAASGARARKLRRRKN
jgi:hypothetical protein